MPQPGPLDLNRFAGSPLPTPPSFNEEDVSDKPSFIQRRDQIEPATIDRMTRYSQCGQASLRTVDRGVAAIYRALKRTGERGRTVIIFTSDNGYYFGEHRLPAGKAAPYEESVRVPLVIRIPSAYRNGVARIPRISAPVANIDLAPTILRLARGVPCRAEGQCRTMDARSLLPLLRGGSSEWPSDRALLLELDQTRGGATRNVGICAYQGVRDGDRMFTEYTQITDQDTGACEPADESELYDLGADPYQLENLAEQPSHAAERQLLSNRLDQLRDCAGIEGRDERVDGRPFCE
jgi:arylsulfatase A-like enzyme